MVHDAGEVRPRRQHGLQRPFDRSFQRTPINLVLHARSDFEVTVIRSHERVRVEVFDQNTRLPSFAAAPPDAYSGRGLVILRELATAWGVESHSDVGKTIWFEVAMAAQPELPAGLAGSALERVAARLDI